MLHVKYFMSKRCYISSYQIWANTGCGKPDWTSSDLASTPEKYQKSEYPQIYTMTRIFLIMIILRHCVLTITCKMTSLMSIIWIEHLCILQFAGMWHCHISTIRTNYLFHSSLNINLYFKSVTSIIEFYPLSEEIKELLTLGGTKWTTQTLPVGVQEHVPVLVDQRNQSLVCWPS